MSNTQDSIAFIQEMFTKTGMKRAVVAVSGGIDSALSVTLTTKALGSENVYPILLPYGTQDMRDAQTICHWNNIPAAQIRTHDIQPMVDSICLARSLSSQDTVRRGNVMARVRMIVVFDVAKELEALVVGTENKSEHYLGYFTRFGDEASDLEPISHLYKTEVRALARALGLPSVFLEKSPSAGLWQDQTDESELGFSYEDADRVLVQLIDSQQDAAHLSVPGVSPEVVTRVCQRVYRQAFKRSVPYRVGEL